MRAWISPALLVAAACCGRHLEAARKDVGLSQASAMPALRPGQVAGVALLGGFRGLYVDYLWYRAEGRFLDPSYPFYELPVIYDLIGQLQPHYPEMWYYTASRMAFDIPTRIPCPSPENDWVWVRRGLDHLAEGIALNAGHPGRSKLRFHLADIYQRRCTPNRYARHGDYVLARLREARGEDAYERAVQLVHQIREDPEALPAWLAKAAHVRFEAAVHAATPAEESANLAASRDEWAWLIRLYQSPCPANHYVRQDPERYRRQVPFLKENFLDTLDTQQQAIQLEGKGQTQEALALWKRLMRRMLLNAAQPEPLSEKHLGKLGALAGTYEALAREFETLPLPNDPEQRNRRDSLIRALREAAQREQGVSERRGGGRA